MLIRTETEKAEPRSVPIYDQLAYVYAPSRPPYIYAQPIAVHCDNRRYHRQDDYYGHKKDHRSWRDHHDEDDEDDD
ncbi:MAG: hypothetical protein V4563_10865 [Pseudomonadota bacterium]